MVGFEKALRAVKVIKDQIQYRSQSLLNSARDYFKVGSHDPIFGANYYSNRKELVMRIKISMS